MIDVSEMIHDPDFERAVKIERTTGGHLEGPKYVSDKNIVTVYGVLASPKNGNEIQQSEQGSRLSGFMNLYVDVNTPLYVTRQTLNKEHNISDVIIDTDGTRYRITGIMSRSQWGYIKAEAQKEGAL